MNLLGPRRKLQGLILDLGFVRTAYHLPIRGPNQYSLIPGNDYVVPLEIDRFDLKLVGKRPRPPVRQQPMDFPTGSQSDGNS